jgi:hypothetical protein
MATRKIYQDCLDEAVIAKKISARTAKELTKYFQDAEREAIKGGASEIAAYSFAATKGAERMMAQIGLSKANAARSIMKIETNWQNASAHKSGLFEGLVNVLGENRAAGMAEPGLVATQKGVYQTMQSRLTGMVNALRTKNAGFTRDVAHAFDMIKELHGEDSGNPSAKLNAESFRGVLDDYWIPRMADEGIPIHNRDDWVFVQKFNPTRLQAMKQEGFTSRMLEAIDAGHLRMRDFESKSPGDYLDPRHSTHGADDLARIMRILGGDEDYAGSYKNIISGGAAGLEPGVTVKDTLLTKYNKQRVFEWQGSKGYEFFLDNFGFGKRNLGEQFLGHIKRISDDLGTAMVLGVDPDKGKDILLDMAKKAELSSGQIGYLDRSYTIASGKGNIAENVTAANIMSAGRSLMSAVLLPKAVLGSLSDFGFMHATSMWNGLPFTKVLGQYLGAMDRTDAMLHGAIFQTGIRGARDAFDQQITNNMGSLGTSGLTKSQWGEAASAGLSRMMGGMADGVMRLTALDLHSSRGRGAIQMALLGELKKQAGLEWSALPEGLRVGMENYGIDAPRWDILRTKGVQPGDVALNPAVIAYDPGSTKFERSAGLRLLAHMDGEAHAAVPEGGVAVAATRLGSTRPGTVPGELARLIQFKGFAMNVYQTHFQRAWDNIAGKTGYMVPGQYAAFLVTETILLGAASLQLRNIVDGKDPENMQSGGFWLKAAAAGGAGGMMTDWLRTMFQAEQANDLSRFAPPLVGFAYNTAMVPMGDLAQMVRGEKTSAGAEATKWARRYLPSLWYTKLAQDRLVYDNLQKWLDPNAAQSFRNIEQQEFKKRGTRYWSHPGQGLVPERAPDPTAAAPGLLR